MLLLGAMLLFALSDVAAKQLAGQVHPLQIAWARYVVAALLLPAGLALGLRSARSSAGPSQILRGLGMAGATLFQISALHHLPLADATALYFVSPLLVTVLAGYVLRETIRAVQWLAVLLGLAGVVVIVRPGGEAIGLSAALPVLSALCWATAIINSRRVLRHDSVVTTLVWSVGTGLVVLGAGMLFVFRMPMPVELLWLAALGFFWIGAHVLVALAYSGGEVAVARLAPLSYSYLIWIIALGQIVLGELPGSSTALGIGLIVTAGLWSQISSRAPLAGCGIDELQGSKAPTRRSHAP
jgi:drug/metabolite transporter (DMT)-like permease